MFLNHRRFFIEQPIKNNFIVLKDKDLLHQIKKVLRLKIGDQIVLLDNSGFEFLVSLEKIKEEISCQIVEKKENQTEPRKKITLIQSLLKHDKFEQVLKFGTSLGINEFIPIISERSIIKEIKPSKLERYQKIIKEAAEQSRRGKLPILNSIFIFNQLDDYFKNNKFLKLIAWEEENNKKIFDFQDKINDSKQIYLMIGPEGGFTEEEIKIAQQLGFQPFSLGKLILRAEIAGVIASTFILN